VVVNKVKNQAILRVLIGTFKDYPIHLFPLSTARLVGMESLKRYIQKHDLDANQVNYDDENNLN
jgi:hypothetical protein